MRDTMAPIRHGIDAVINGFITYKSLPVPVYDEKVFTGEIPDIYILLSTQQESPGDGESECTFSIRSSIDLEILAKSGSEVSKDVIDDVSNQLYGLIIPSPATAGFTLSGYQIGNAFRESALTRNVSISETQSILQKSIRFVFSLIQQN